MGRLDEVRGDERNTAENRSEARIVDEFGFLRVQCALLASNHLARRCSR